MKPDYSLQGMQQSLERALFQDVIRRNVFVGTYYSQNDSPFLHGTFQTLCPHIPHIYTEHHLISELPEAQTVLMKVSRALEMSKDKAYDYIERTCRALLEERGFLNDYQSENLDDVRAMFIKLGIQAYMIGFEAGNAEQCAMFCDIIDMFVAEMDKIAGFNSLSRSQKGTNNLLAGIYFTEVMEDGGNFATYHSGFKAQ